jgi:hypothetical protein
MAVSMAFLHSNVDVDGSGKVLLKIANGSVQIANESVPIANGSVQIAHGSVQIAHGSVRVANGSGQYVFIKPFRGGFRPEAFTGKTTWTEPHISAH